MGDLFKVMLTHPRLSVLSDLFTSLAAGWFATILILPGIWDTVDLGLNVFLLLNNLFLGILFLITAFYLKDKSYGKN